MPGLVLESGSLDALVERLRIAVHELVDLNGVDLPHSGRLSNMSIKNAAVPSDQVTDHKAKSSR